MILILSVAVVGVVAYAFLNEGLLTAVTMCANVVLAGLAAFGFYEPLADELEKALAGSILDGCEDALSLSLVFCAVMGVLRLATNNLAHTEIELPARAQQALSAVAGATAGYLLAGFLVCMVATLPLPEKFLGYDGPWSPDEPAQRKILPPDRVWLALMHHAGLGPFAAEGKTFDQEGTWPLRYARRRA
ncbi:MAG: CvpA family protein, partial [Gemmataceae bacterium]|nr:CvpA family protein [Gemmataceae bacterium]